MADAMVPQFIARPVAGFAQRVFKLVGFDLVDNRPAPGNRDIRDAIYYRPMFQPWLTPEWRAKLRADDPRSVVPLHARYILYCSALEAVRHSEGDLAECGAYQGGTAKILTSIAPSRLLHVFDTFEGMPPTDPMRDKHKAGDFADTSIESVGEYLAEHKNVVLVKGFVPDSLAIVRDRTFSFVHVDLDIYSAIKGACEFFYPRMEPGGVMLFDDYGYPSCPGARMAVDEFFSGKPETVLVMPTGQASIVRDFGVASGERREAA